MMATKQHKDLTGADLHVNANLTGPITSVANATSIASQTGTGTKFVMDTSPILVTPDIGNATAITINISGQLTSTLAIGFSPFAITSTTVNTNLNADLWDGYQFADYLDQAVKTTSSPTFVQLTTPTIASTGDLTLDPAGSDVLLDGGLTVGSTTQAGDDNLRVEGTSALVGATTITSSLKQTGGTAQIGAYNASGKNPPASDITNGGLGVDWNLTGGSAEVGLWNVYEWGPIISFAFRQKTGTTSYSDLFYITTTTFMPKGAGTKSTGDASNYWNDISYKTLTDRAGMFSADKDKSYNMFKNLKGEQGKGYCKKLEDKGKARLKFSDLKAIDPDMVDLALEPAEQNIIFDDNIVIDNQITTEVFNKGDIIAIKDKLTRWRINKTDIDDGKLHITQAAEGLELTAYISYLSAALQKSIEEIELLKQKNISIKERISALELR